MRTQLVRSLTASLPKPVREQIQRWMASAGPSIDTDRPYGND
jgi:hypothetical protein